MKRHADFFLFPHLFNLFSKIGFSHGICLFMAATIVVIICFRKCSFIDIYTDTLLNEFNYNENNQLSI